MSPESSAFIDTYRSAARLDPGTVRAHTALATAIARLLVLHRPTPVGANESPHFSNAGSADAPGQLRIHTCQREIQLELSSGARDDSPAFEPRCPGTGRHARVETHRALAGYRFLLEFASGLKSAIPGETNVFGQVREAWRRFEQRQPRDSVRALAPVMDTLFRDVREVRTRFLQGLGGQSYATLARRLLAPGASSRVLIVGFGELGRTMPAKFSHTGLAVFSRTRPEDLPTAAVRFFGAGQERDAAAWATHVVMCVPRGADIDALWIEALRARADLRVVHLACRRGERGSWGEFQGLIDLDDLFDLQREQAQLRTRQLARAREACAALAERAVSAAAIHEL